MSIEQLILAGRVLWEEGLVTSHGGNLSIRTGSHTIIITKTGTKLGFLNKEDFIEVPIPSSKKVFPEASSELVVHSQIYLENPQATAVVHAHPLATVALSFHLEEITPMDVEGKLTFKSCPVIEVKKPHASKEMAQKVATCLKEYQIVCVKGHGTFATGKNLEEALFFTSSLEFSSKLLLIQAKKALL